MLQRWGGLFLFWLFGTVRSWFSSSFLLLPQCLRNQWSIHCCSVNSSLGAAEVYKTVAWCPQLVRGALVVPRAVSVRSLFTPAEGLASQTSWCICPPGLSLLGSGPWPASVHQNRQWLWEVQGHKIVPPFQEEIFFSWPWICVLLGFGFCWFFLVVFFPQTLSRWVIKIWNLKSIYEPADLMCSAGSVYNCVSSWTTLHILLFLLPSQTPHPLCSSSTHSAVVSS